MGREWQPGDVAMVTALNRKTPYRAFFNGEVWVECESTSSHLMSPASVRPLVVIDPEDPEQVERLIHLYVQEGTRRGYPMPSHQDADRLDAMADALREFADPKPPKPEEPTGLGAVVEATCECSEEPHRFVYEPQSDRFEGRPGGKGRRPWKSRCGQHVWVSLRNVCVLSEGVQA